MTAVTPTEYSGGASTAGTSGQGHDGPKGHRAGTAVVRLFASMAASGVPAKVGWTVLSIGLFFGLWEFLWAIGWEIGRAHV